MLVYEWWGEGGVGGLDKVVGLGDDLREEGVVMGGDGGGGVGLEEFVGFIGCVGSVGGGVDDYIVTGVKWRCSSRYSLVSLTTLNLMAIVTNKRFELQ